MDIKLIHDLSPQQLKAGFWKTIDGFFFATYWYLQKPKAYDFVLDVARKGGLKKAFGINENILYIHGSDRIVETENKSEDRVFLRPPLISLREAICFNPDVIQVMDLPLSAGDNEDRICEKLAINRDIVLDYDKWLVENKFRSSNRYKDGLPKFSAFMLLGVCHGDTAETYAEEASFMKRYCEVIGIPMAGLLVQKRGVSVKTRYDYALHVLNKVLEVVGSTRVVQLMGFGLSDITEAPRFLKLAKKYDATLWFESSTIIRNSTHARKILSLNVKNPSRLEYVNISRVKGAEKFSTLDVFRENNKILKNILNQTSLELNG